MKLKKLKRALALALALTVAGTTNLGGLENVVNIEAATTTEIEVTESYDGLEWVFKGTKTNGVVTNTSTNLSGTDKFRLSNRSVKVPNKIGGYEVTVLDANIFRGTELTGLSINNPNLVILDSICEGCNKLESIDITCKSFAKENDVSPSYTFFDCNALKNAKVCTETINSLAFYQCDSLVDLQLSSPTNKLTISSQAFSDCSALKNLKFSDTLTSISVGNSAFLACNSLENLVIPCNVSIGKESFSKCIKLRNVEFSGEVTSMGNEAFKNSFLIEEEDGKQVKKTITFKDSVITSENAFANCEGLTNVVLSDKSNSGNRFIGNNVFANCKSLSDIDFGEGYNTFYGDNIFYQCPQLKSIKLKNLQSNSKKYLSGSSIEEMEIIDNNQSGSGARIDISLGTDKIPLKKIITNKDYVSGNIDLNNVPDLEMIVLENPQITTCNINITQKTNSNSNDNVKIYGYGSKVSSNNIYSPNSSVVESWAKNTNGVTFQNIVTDLKTEYQGQIIGTTDLNAIDKSKFVVTSMKSYMITNNQRETITPSTDGSDLTGYVLVLPDKLIYGSNSYSVVYGGEIVSNTFEVVEKQAISMEIAWKEEAISQLVSNQPITPADIISGASIKYNDGDIETISADKLTLNKSTTVTGDNTFIATFVDENGTKVTAGKTFSIKENYITSIKAEYPSEKILYVGDKIDISKIKLTPIYKYNNDNTVNRDITATKISASELKEIGANEIKVYYNGIETTMVVSAAAVVPTKIYAMLDSNSVFYEGQENIDPKSIVTTIEYNNGTKKVATVEEINCEIIQSTGTNVQVRVSYGGLESIVTIPVTAKEVVSIKANANIASAAEGTTLAKTIVDSIEVTYNNGKTETLDASNIKYDELTFNDYAIVADTKNVITVNYLGKSTEITIVGISNTITSIFAEYIGSGQIVGTEIPVSDVAVHAVNLNGQITDITDGVLLENAIPYNVGANTVIVHYGSLSYTINVTGLPAPAPTVAPTTTSEAGIIVPTATVVPTQTPKQTSQPSTTQTPVPTQSSTNSNVVVVPTSDIANAPVVANTAVTLKSSNSKIVTATTNTYNVYTNKSVVITINAVSASNIKYQIVAKGAKLSDAAWKDVADNKITISKTTKPSIVYIQYTDANGAIQTIHTNGFSVDKTKATVNVKKNKTYKVGKKVTFKDASGIKSAKLDGKKVKSGTKIKKKGTHTLVITDKAGNKTTIKFKVK